MKRMPIAVMGRLAALLADAGIASLRYDKRGVGESEGVYLSAGLNDNIDDARAALGVLRDRPEVDPDRVIVIGHSEGAFIASALAATPGLAGAVLLAGAARSGEEVLYRQACRVADTLSTPARFFAKLLRQDVIKAQTKRLDRIRASSEDVIRLRFVTMNVKWFREFLVFDPSEALAEATTPVLAITGEKDLQVDPTDVGRMKAVVPTTFTGYVVPDVTHLLRTESGPASFSTYKQQARQPLDQRVCDLVTDWITEQTAERPHSTVINGKLIPIDTASRDPF